MKRKWREKNYSIKVAWEETEENLKEEKYD